ncbi:hypothetical protein Nepgr_024895 [Nepenthes gracilis]|uniref:Uncharacterized protein n=1 Tax=Nepenthes gracilis TaxID=150966 RepID=A0AAD3XZ20_NEPGR|nr:hypothetical protein Nepgr_024895 [Nepenthes gracilis]
MASRHVQVLGPVTPGAQATLAALTNPGLIGPELRPVVDITLPAAALLGCLMNLQKRTLSFVSAVEHKSQKHNVELADNSKAYYREVPFLSDASEKTVYRVSNFPAPGSLHRSAVLQGGWSICKVEVSGAE